MLREGSLKKACYCLPLWVGVNLPPKSGYNPNRRNRYANHIHVYGIIVRMYYADNKQHHAPHIHVEFGGSKAVFNINDGKLLAGKFPNSKTRLVQAWIEIHREELNADWKLAVNGEEVFKIDPLK
jgi:Domain of unknown function (DUF4160)